MDLGCSRIKYPIIACHSEPPALSLSKGSAAEAKNLVLGTVERKSPNPQSVNLKFSKRSEILASFLVTGGAGFIGCNYAHRLLSRGERVTVYDNLSRRGTEANVAHLREQHGAESFRLVVGDVRDYETLAEATRGTDVVVHLAGQTAVTTSVVDPRSDFEHNALGTFNALEAARHADTNPIFIYASTNKVYGRMEEVAVIEQETRYAYRDFPQGIPEAQPLDFHSPYGCSKGAGDQYVRDYARIYGLPTVVFRQSCLAGASLVQTPQGDIPIRDLRNPGQVWSLHQGTDMQMQVSHGPFSPSLDGRRLYYIETGRGYSIQATGDHRFYTPGGYLPLEKILYGGFVAVSPQAKYVQRPSPVTFSDDIILDEETIRRALIKCKRQPRYNKVMLAWLKAQGLVPLRYNHPYIYVIAQLVGYLTGDAHLYRHFKPSRGKVDLGIQVYARAEELGAIKEDFRLLGFRPGKTVVSTSRSELLSGHVIEGTSHKFALYSTAVFVFFESLGVPIGRKADIPFEVPAWILQAPAPVQDAYLRGLFGAEMTAPGFYKRGDGQRQGEFPAPTFAQSKAHSLEVNALRFRQQIMDLLAQRGVETRPFETGFSYRKGGERSRCYQFRVLAARDNLIRFARIGYAYNRKRNVQLYRTVEFMQTGLPYRAYEQWLSVYTRGLDAPDLLWDHMVEKREVPLQPVYDITVPETHNFIANGFLVHNCIYGPRQMGVEDQGWVAWFIIAAVTGQPITIYGNGKQVRDMLFIDDLLDAYDAAIAHIDVAAGQVYNVGGGPAHTMSVWAEFGPILERLIGHPVPVSGDDWRPGDQPIYISDIRKAGRELGWRPRVGIEEGIRRLYEWVVANRSLFA